MAERVKIDPITEETLSIVKEKLGRELDDIVVERAVLGLFFSGVKLSCGTGGLCYTPLKEIPEAVCCPSSAREMPLSGRLKNRPLRYYLEDLASPFPLRRMLGIAVLNAVSDYVWRRYPENQYELVRGVDAFDLVRIPPKGKKTVVVGALVPMLRKLLKENADFTVLEMDKRTLKGAELDHFLPAEDAEDAVPFASLLVITGVTIFNHSLSPLLEMARKGAEILVTGPTASMIPDAFFKRGVTELGGIQVTKVDETLDLLAEGGSGYHMFGKTADRIVIRRKSYVCA